MSCHSTENQYLKTLDFNTVIALTKDKKHKKKKQESDSWDKLMKENPSANFLNLSTRKRELNTSGEDWDAEIENSLVNEAEKSKVKPFSN